MEILAELDPKDESASQGDIHEHVLGLAAAGWADVDRLDSATDLSQYHPNEEMIKFNSQALDWATSH